MKIGVQIHPQNTSMAALKAGWQAVDELGVDSLWTWDHFFPARSNARRRSTAEPGLVGSLVDAGADHLILGLRAPYDLHEVERLVAARGI